MNLLRNQIISSKYQIPLSIQKRKYFPCVSFHEKGMKPQTSSSLFVDVRFNSKSEDQSSSASGLLVSNSSTPKVIILDRYFDNSAFRSIPFEFRANTEEFWKARIDSVLEKKLKFNTAQQIKNKNNNYSHEKEFVPLQRIIHGSADGFSNIFVDLLSGHRLKHSESDSYSYENVTLWIGTNSEAMTESGIFATIVKYFMIDIFPVTKNGNSNSSHREIYVSVPVSKTKTNSSASLLDDDRNLVQVDEEFLETETQAKNCVEFVTELFSTNRRLQQQQQGRNVANNIDQDFSRSSEDSMLPVMESTSLLLFKTTNDVAFTSSAAPTLANDVKIPLLKQITSFDRKMKPVRMFLRDFFANALSRKGEIFHPDTNKKNIFIFVQCDSVTFRSCTEFLNSSSSSQQQQQQDHHRSSDFYFLHSDKEKVNLIKQQQTGINSKKSFINIIPLLSQESSNNNNFSSTSNKTNADIESTLDEELTSKSSQMEKSRNIRPTSIVFQLTRNQDENYQKLLQVLQNFYNVVDQQQQQADASTTTLILLGPSSDQEGIFWPDLEKNDDEKRKTNREVMQNVLTRVCCQGNQEMCCRIIRTFDSTSMEHEFPSNNNHENDETLALVCLL